MAAQFIIRVRRFEGVSRRAYGGNVASYSAWKTKSRHATFDEAYAACNRAEVMQLKPGTEAIFYRGKRIEKHSIVKHLHPELYCVHGTHIHGVCFEEGESCPYGNASHNRKRGVPGFVSPYQ